MQLVSIGAQDVYITGDPQITFFKLVYRRHTNFAIESREQLSSNNITSTGRTDIDIKREGDLINHMYLRIKNPVRTDVNHKKTLAKTFVTNVINQNIHVENAQHFNVNMDIMITAGVYNTSNSTTPFSMYRTTILSIDYDNNILTITGKYPVIKNASSTYTTGYGFVNGYTYNMGFILYDTTNTAKIHAGTKAPFQVVEIKGYNEPHRGENDSSWIIGNNIYPKAGGVRGTSTDTYTTAANIAVNGISGNLATGPLITPFNVSTSASGIYSPDGSNEIPYDMILPAGAASESWHANDASSDSCCSNNLNGYHLIDRIDLLIGGNTIDTMTGDLMDIWNELTITNGNKHEFNLMTSVENSQYAYLPLYFWFNKTPGLALPLIALQYHTVTVRIKWKDNLPIVDQNAQLFIDYIFCKFQVRLDLLTLVLHIEE